MPLGRQAGRERNRKRREGGKEKERKQKKKERILILPNWAASGRLHWVDRFAKSPEDLRKIARSKMRKNLQVKHF